ncbi:MAG TPA: trypsin-like peptidase domain-containing protein [Pirellulales bacterium]|nr:trypsin-like peptidase domain-containing protein [Pirellulales bacterium]
MSTRTARLILRSRHAFVAGFAILGASWLSPPAVADELQHRRTPIVVAVEQARPAIVNIHGEKTVSSDGHGSQGGEVGRRVNGMGTGIVIDERGYIVTNFHVVEGVKKITVTTADRETYVADLISNDAKTDLAVIKIDAHEKLPVIHLGSSNDLMPGETVVAVGNAFGYEHTVTCGIISALHRTVQVSDAQSYEDLIQTDASINPGNSGGPLLNIDGEMIGINVAVRAGAQGIGFAIPTDKALGVVTDLLSTRRVKQTWHGVVAKPLEGAGEGIVVESVDDNSPAAESGLRPGDVIRAVDDLQVARPLDLERALLGHREGEEVPLEVDRENESVTVNLVLAAAPKTETEPADPIWDVLGLELQAIPSKQFLQRHRTQYRGGLSVVDVRPDSPAAKQGIRAGDTLVGMHIWETITVENVNYVLNRSDFASLAPLKFYILRQNEPRTLYGYLNVSVSRR